MFDSLSSIDTSHTSWKIKVRLTRMWPSFLKSNNESTARDNLRGYNLLLLDDDNCHMHAFVYAENWKEIAKDMVEGGLYLISNFYTKVATGTLRPTKAKIIINFSNSTTVLKLPEDDFMIPNHKFECIDLSDLFRIASGYEENKNPPFSTDVIGVLEDFEHSKTIKTSVGDREIVKFRITDGRYSHKVTLWGQQAVDTDEMYSQIDKRPIIVIVTGAKLAIFKSSVQINTLPSSKIYLNLDDPVVTSMRTRLEEEGYKVPENFENTPVQTPPVPVIPSITLLELSEKTNLDDQKLKFFCSVKIKNVEQAEKWWYCSCTDCQDEVLKLEGRYKCLTCPKCIPVAEKRYKINVLAADSTESFNFVLSDKASKRIIGKTATKLISDNLNLEATGEYPTIIKDLNGKEFTFQIEISSDNVLLKSKTFLVTDAFDSSLSTKSTSNATIDGLSFSGTSENTIDLSNCEDTPGSAHSITKRLKMDP